jgi:hypothetical protein
MASAKLSTDQLLVKVTHFREIDSLLIPDALEDAICSDPNFPQSPLEDVLYIDHEHVLIFTHDYDNDIRIALIGKGDGGPGTTLKKAIAYLPMGLGNIRRIVMCADGKPTERVTKAAPSDHLPALYDQALELVANPNLRQIILEQNIF